MNTCKRCQASIPKGRNFCTPHYMEALAEYESSMVNYQNELSVWNSMSAQDQAAAHAAAEQSAVGGYAGVVGFVIGLAFPQISRQIMMSKLKWRITNAAIEICP